VRRAHAHLQRSERMLDGHAALPHRLRVLIQPLLRPPLHARAPTGR
jgi:hypothetical protein